MPNTMEVRRFFDVMQEQYVEAFCNSDKDGMFETSYSLTRGYAAVGNIALAGRWAYECEKHTKDPAKILGLNLMLLRGIVRYKMIEQRSQPDMPN